MPDNDVTRYDHEVTIYESGNAKTNRYERLFLADLSGICLALDEGFVLELRGSSTNRISASIRREGYVPKLWGEFSGLDSAILQLSDAFRSNSFGRLPEGPPITSLGVVEAFLLHGGNIRISRFTTLYQAELQEKLPSVTRRQGAKILTFLRTEMRRASGKDPYEAILQAFEEKPGVEEVLSF